MLNILHQHSSIASCAIKRSAATLRGTNTPFMMLSSTTHTSLYIQCYVSTSPTTDSKFFRNTALLTLYTPQKSKQLSNTPINKSKLTSSATNPNPNTQKPTACPTTASIQPGAHSPELILAATPVSKPTAADPSASTRTAWAAAIVSTEACFAKLLRMTGGRRPCRGGGYFGRAAPYDRAHRNRFNRRNRNRED
jgi:hypothetical protein